jgi:hypothetical protein
MKLTAINGKNSYCGPAAVAALTGVTTTKAAEFIRTAYNRKAIRRVYPEELVHALKEMGYRATYSLVSGKPTMAKWLREREDRNAANILFLTGHFVAVKGNKFVDNHTKEPVWISKAPGRRKRVLGVIEVERP